MVSLCRPLLFSAIVYFAIVTALSAAELIMVDSRSCPYCARFHRQIGVEYNESAAGRIAPLRSINPRRRWPSDLANVTPAYAVPTFILVDNGREIGRFAGYATPETFWARLGVLWAMLPQPNEQRDNLRSNAGAEASIETPIDAARLPRPRPEPTIVDAQNGGNA